MTEHAYYHYGLSQSGRRFSWAKSLSVVRKHISLDSWTFAFLKAKIHNSIQIVTHKKCATFAIYQGFQRTSVKIKYPLVKTYIKKVYNVMPFKKELFSALKFFWKPNENIFKHLHFRGVIKVQIDKTRWFKMNHYGFQVENEIFWQGLDKGWEKESVRLWINLCQNSETILDIGANTGLFSLIAKTVNPSAKVYAFEPVNRVFEKLQANVRLNNFDIQTIEKAVSNSDGNAIIYDVKGAEHTLSVTVNKNYNPPGTAVVETKIETITLNSFIKQAKIDNVDLIKLDVEMHEPEALEGFSEYLSKFKPTILIEILNNQVGERVGKIFENLDYMYFNIDDKKGGIRQVEIIAKSDYTNYLLCKPSTARKIGLIK